MPQGNTTSHKPQPESVQGHRISIADPSWQVHPKNPKFCGLHTTAKAIWYVNSVGFCRECKPLAYAAAAKVKGV